MGGSKGDSKSKSKANKKKSKGVKNVRSAALSSHSRSSRATFISLHDELAALGLRIQTVLADGNCFFRAIADQVTGHEADHHAVRSNVVNYMQQNSDLFSPFVEDDEGFDKYIARMRKETTWAGHMEVQAASLCYDANINIYQSGQPTWRVINFTPTDHYRCVHLSYHDGQHYNSVRGAHDPGNGPAETITIKPCTLDSAALDGESSFGELQVKMVAENTLCFNKEQVVHALCQCGGKVDDATELLISQMALAGDETSSTSGLATAHRVVESRSADADFQCGADASPESTVRCMHRGSDTEFTAEPRPENDEVSVQVRVHEHSVEVTVIHMARNAKKPNGTPTCSSNDVVLPGDHRTGRPKGRGSKRTQDRRGPGKAQPANNKPCPCQSGRRYKHCCKKRVSTVVTQCSVLADRTVLAQLEMLDI
eukprot:jgi/Ulvmu1/4803/UM020_0088.1